MASSSDNISMAVFCDFENVALGVRDANYEKFDIQPVLERLLLKGSIVVKKAYCDWERYKGFKAAMHESNFELIEIPHVRQSGKNSADIRLVVDALDLCYTKSHVNTFVIISGDSDFSPLVSKLRENNKHVIAVGVKQSTSDLLVANCDEFIFYDDLVREVKRTVAKREERKARPQAEKRPPSDESNRRKEELEARKALALEMVVETFDALISERGDSGKIWASLLKDTLKRRRPDFNESYFGFSTFGKLLEEAQSRGLLEFGRDEKSGAYVYRSQNAASAIAVEAGADEQIDESGATGGDAVADEAVEAVEAAPVNPRNNNRPQERSGQQERPRSRTSFRTPIVQTGSTDDVETPDDAEPEIDAQPAEPQQQQPRGRNRGRGRDRERQPVERQPGEAQPAVNAGEGKGQPKQEGRHRGRNRDRLPADAQANRERVPAEVQPKSHENALPAELRSRGRGRNGPRNQNAPRYPEASEELAFHKQQQALEAAAAAAGQADDIVAQPAPPAVDETAGQADAVAPVAPEVQAKPAASERRRAPRKTAAQKAAEAAGNAVAETAASAPVADAVGATDAAAPVATAEPAAPATMDALPDSAAEAGEVNGNVAPVARPARKPAARKAAAAPAPVAEKPAARPRRAAKPKADPA
jgi:uncharacterized LabA/DUF88 family protein